MPNASRHHHMQNPTQSPPVSPILPASWFQAPSISPTSKPSSQRLPHHPNANFWKLVAMMLMLVIITVGGTNLYLFTQKSDQTTSTDNNTALFEPNPTLNNTGLPPTTTLPSEKSPQSEFNTSPLPNTLYLATFEEKQIIFYTNTDLQNYFQNGEAQHSNNVGTITFKDGTNQHPFPYPELTSPRKIITLEEKIQVINNFTLSNTYLYLSLGKESTTNPDERNVFNEILQIDIPNAQAAIIWKSQVHIDRPQYDNVTGMAYLDEAINDQYLAFHLLNCYQCSPSSKTVTLILNLDSLQERYLGPVGNLSFDLENNVVTYQNLAESSQPCDPSPGCRDDNTRQTFQPEGVVLTQPLP